MHDMQIVQIDRDETRIEALRLEAERANVELISREISEFRREQLPGQLIFYYAHSLACCEDVRKLTLAGASVVAYCDKPTPQKVASITLMGAIDYFHWPISAGELIDRLPQIAQRHRQLERAQTRQAEAIQRIFKLTMREKDVLGGMISGLSSKEMGFVLKISPRTVDIYRTSLRKKLKCDSLPQVFLLAADAGLFGRSCVSSEEINLGLPLLS